MPGDGTRRRANRSSRGANVAPDRSAPRGRTQEVHTGLLRLRGGPTPLCLERNAECLEAQNNRGRFPFHGVPRRPSCAIRSAGPPFVWPLRDSQRSEASRFATVLEQRARTRFADRPVSRAREICRRARRRSTAARGRLCDTAGSARAVRPSFVSISTCAARCPG